MSDEPHAAVDLPPTRPGEDGLASARLVCARNEQLLFRQHSQFDALDLKASFVVATAAVLLGGLLTAIATKPPSNPHIYDVAVVAVALLLVTVVAGLFVWWPRAVVTVNPRGLHEHHFRDNEGGTLFALSSHLVDSWEKNAKVEDRKVLGIRIASACFAAALVLGAISVLATTT